MTVIMKYIYKMCYKEMKRILIKTVKDADNQSRDNENNR